MKIIVSGLHLKKFPELEEYAQKRVAKLSKYHPKIEMINVRLISKKSHRGQENDYYCEIEVDIPKNNLVIVDTEREMDKAIDRAVERMKRQIVKIKNKEISKKHKEGLLTKYRNRFF
ncbi:MAG: ribosome-associated translation inhibitor RaiA [Candidatus Curtissbacteria bacterium]